MDAGDTEEADLLRRLNAFRDHLHSKCAADGNDRVDNDSGFRAGGAIDSEAAIDLERIEPEPPQMVEARIAGAKSSIAIRTPKARSASMLAQVKSGCSRTAVSVISSSSRRGSNVRRPTRP